MALPMLQDTRQFPHVAVELLICGVKRGNLGKGLNAFIAAFVASASPRAMRSRLPGWLPVFAIFDYSIPLAPSG
jgi:hypothetical protein